MFKDHTPQKYVVISLKKYSNLKIPKPQQPL